MKHRKTLALVLTVVGLTLTIAGPFLPGGVHLVENDPPRAGHVTDLITDGAGSVYAGTQAGEVWHLSQGVWEPVRIDLGGHPVTAMLPKPGQKPVGTADGLYALPAGTPPLSGRVSSLLETEAGLLVGTGTGLRLLADGRWLQPEADGNIYSLFAQRRGGDHWLHAGTVGAGALYAPSSAPDGRWMPNNAGLPDGVNVFSFAATDGGLLMAGTDDGLYWQAEPGQDWTALIPALAGRRVLSLYLAPAETPEQPQRLWLGSDDGLHWVDLAEDGAALTAQGELTAADDPAHQPRFGVSWIVPTDDGVMISAGDVFAFGATRLHGWYWISLVGIGLILAAGWLMPRPRPAEADSG
jgi:hypothetical protein